MVPPAATTSDALAFAQNMLDSFALGTAVSVAFVIVLLFMAPGGR